MKSLFIFLALSLPSSLFAESALFECSFNNMQDIHNFSFRLQEIGNINVDYIIDESNWSEDYNMYLPVMTSEDSIAITLNRGEGGGWVEHLENGVKITADAVSCDIAELFLYKNSGHQSGYYKVEHNCSGPEVEDTYAVVRCELTNI